MRSFVLIILLFISGCSTIGSSVDMLSFKNVQTLVPGKSSRKNIVDKFGQPSEKRIVKEHETWIFYDKITGFQRLDVVFTGGNDLLQSVLWLPHDDELEVNLDVAKGKFPNAKFVAIVKKDPNPHMFSSSTTYFDDELGVSILVEGNKNRVSALAWSNMKLRQPSTSSKSVDTMIKYEIGE